MISPGTLLSLIKYKVSIAVTFTAITGYIVCTGQLDLKIIRLAISVFILAGGSSALNQWQEWRFDAKMKRTNQRPIPSGKIASSDALLVSLLSILLGLLFIYFWFGIPTAALGIFNILWYNLLYTNLKKVTPFAVVPGSLVGAIPVFMGWSAGGGSIFEQTIVFIAFFLFIWQIPHFWLLMLKYGKEYQEAGFPTINQTIKPSNLKFIIFSWIIATSFTSIAIPLFLANISQEFFVSIFVLNILFVAIFSSLSFGKMSEFRLNHSFISINIYMLLFMVMLIAHHLFAR